MCNDNHYFYPEEELFSQPVNGRNGYHMYNPEFDNFFNDSNGASRLNNGCRFCNPRCCRCCRFLGNGNGNGNNDNVFRQRQHDVNRVRNHTRFREFESSHDSLSDQFQNDFIRL